FEHAFHDMLRLWPRDEDGRGHFKIESPKGLAARDVLGRLARSAFRDQLGVVPEDRRRHLLVWVGVKISAVAPQNVHQQDFRRELRGRHLVGEKGLESLPKCGTEEHGMADCRFSIESCQCWVISRRQRPLLKTRNCQDTCAQLTIENWSALNSYPA